MHPLYDDEQLVARVTQEHVSAGRSVLQMFQFPGGERQHSRQVLRRLQLPLLARILSLGCGVAGMERHWHDARPDLGFELVNKSRAQLEQCLCPGKTVQADLERYTSEARPFDCAVLAYVLGHVDPRRALDVAKRHTKAEGVVLVLDVFDGSREFNDRLAYTTPRTADMEAAGLTRAAGPEALMLTPYFGLHEPWIREAVTPGMYLGRGGHG